MNPKLKLILRFWRIPLYFLIALLLLMTVALTSEKLEGAFSALALFLAFPGFVITLVWAAFLSVIRPIQYHRNGWPEVDRLPEVTFFGNIADAIGDEIGDIAELSGGMRLRYLGFRILGIILIAGGIVLAFITLYVIGTLVMIAGATLWIMANPRTYNRRVEGVRMVSCAEGDDTQKLYTYCRKRMTSLGTPYLARLRGFPTDVLVFGPDDADNMVIVYHAKRADCFYVSSVCMPGRIIEVLSEPGVQPEHKDSEAYDTDTALSYIVSLVEAALE